MSALQFKIERPEDRRRRKQIFQIASYVVLGLVGLIAIFGLIWYVGLDRIPPEISLESPEDGFTTNTEKVFLSYNVKDRSEVECNVLLNGESVSTARKVEVSLKQGSNSWKVVCSDKTYYKNNASSKVRNIFLLRPLKVDKIRIIEAPDSNKGLLQVYEDTSKDSLGMLLLDVLPNNGGLIIHNETKGGHLSVSLWGEPSIKEQSLRLNNITIKLPALKNLNGTFALYIDSEGNTYHSRADHKYLEDSLNLNWEDALSLEHRAN